MVEIAVKWIPESERHIAYVSTDASRYAYGRSRSKAVGRLVECYPDLFQVNVISMGSRSDIELPKKGKS